MPVNTPHREYDAYASQWATVRDCMGGQSRMRLAGEAYVPRLTDQTPEEYQRYLFRGLFFNGTKRTHEAMFGLLFRKSPTTTGLDKITELAPMLSDADLCGKTFMSYAMQVVEEVSALARCGTFIDWNEKEARAYAAFYTAENIINWHVARINGRTMLAMLVLREYQMDTAEDQFAGVSKETFRLVINTGASVTSEVWQRVKGQNGDAELKRIAEPTEMQRRGKGLAEIPFVWHGARENSPDVESPPLIDVANVNVSHFQSSVDLEHGRHLTGLPTPYACGFEFRPGEPFRIGSSAAWTTEKENAKAGFLEFTGQGLNCLKEALAEKQQQMAALGARLIEIQKKDAEAYETVMLRSSAESATLASISRNCTASLTQVLAWARWWHGTYATVTDAAAKIVFQLTRDFVSATMTPEMLREVVAAWQQTAISQETLFYLLERGEMFREGTTLEEERQRILDNPPMPPPMSEPSLQS